MFNYFHLLIGEDGEPIAVAYGPARHLSKTIAMIRDSANYSIPDAERGRLMALLVDTANKQLSS